MKKILGIVLVCLVVALSATAAFATTGTNNAWLKNPILRLWNAVHGLQDQLNSISLIPGPQGEPGPAGPAGECSCSFSEQEFQALAERVEQLEAGGQTIGYIPDCLVNSDCFDNNECTDEYCDSQLGCVYTDNSLCTGDTGSEEQASASGELAISEMMYNPDAVTDTYGEWVEIYNAGTEDVNLQGWGIMDQGTDSYTFPEEFTLESGSYALLCKNTDSSVNGGLFCDLGYSSFTLGNTADSIILVDPEGIIIDQVAYDVAVEPWKSLNKAGYSLQLDPYLATWCNAFEPIGNGDYGTPGYANSDCNMG